MATPEQVAYAANILQIVLGLAFVVGASFSAIRYLKRIRIIILPLDDDTKRDT